MARINLLGWRTERRKQREREFYMLLLASAIAGIVVLFLLIGWMGARIDNQQQRNAFLQTEIKSLDAQIKADGQAGNGRVTARVQGNGLRAGTLGVGEFELRSTVDDPMGQASTETSLTANRIGIGVFACDCEVSPA